MSDKTTQRAVLKTALVMVECVDLPDSELVRSIGKALGLPDIDLPTHEIREQHTVQINSTLPQESPAIQATLPIEPPVERRVERRLEDVDFGEMQRIRGLKSPRGIPCALEQVDLEEAIRRADTGGRVLIRYLKGPSAGHLRKVIAKWVKATISVPVGVDA